MRLAFMGTAAFAVPSLEALGSGGHDVTSVFTQPDRPSGRGHNIHFSPVKEAALTLGLTLHQPDLLKSDATRRLIEEISPEVIVVVAYGRILPPWLVHFPPRGVINVHGSLLPKYRGAAPINWAMAKGESRTGVTTMQIDEGMDTGPVYLSEETPIDPQETAPELSARLATMGAEILIETLDGIVSGRIRPTPQDEGHASIAPRLRKKDGYISWQESAEAIHNKVRAFLPWPSVVVGFRGKNCRILRSRPAPGRDDAAEPGTIVHGSNRLAVCCGDRQWLEIEQLQLENKSAVSGVEFVHGVHLVEGERFVDLEVPNQT